MTLISKTRRDQAPEADALRLGCGWGKKDLDKPWVLIESTHGDSHPGSIHLGDLAKFVEKGLLTAGGAPAHYTCTDICDGIAQGTAGMHYSLPSREIMVMATEMHAKAGHFDGMVLLSGCDKSLPAHLIAALKINIPTIIVPGGVMESGPEGFTLEGVGTAFSKKRRGELSEADYSFLRQAACPSSGSCAFFGTAATMQLLTEVIGLAHPSTALVPSHLNALSESARAAGDRILGLVKEDLKPRDIFTQHALENALVVHAATGGSTNALIHLAAMAYEAGLEFSYDKVNEINRKVPFILNLKPSGKFEANKLYYAGGVYRLMKELKEFLHLDAMTVSGLTLGENMELLEKSGHFLNMPRYLLNYGGVVEDLIRPLDKPLRPDGAVRILKGNLAPEGAVVKVSAMAQEMTSFTGCAKVFDAQQDAIDAIFDGRIESGDAIVIRYEGPAATGMPEQFYVTEAIASNPKLATSTMLITDGRFSGASRGPAIGHVSPEAFRGGPIALVENDDLIRFDINDCSLTIVGIAGEEQSADRISAILKSRQENFKQPEPIHTSGLLGLFSRCVRPVEEGGGIS